MTILIGRSGTICKINMRYKYLDTARLLMMILGVIMHSAGFFAIESDQAVYFDERFQQFSVFVAIIHIFRMPVFFMIAGFLGAMALEHYPDIKFIERRTHRLLVPFAIGVAFLNPATLRLIEDQPLLGGHYPAMHLWFLPVLFIAACLHQAFFGPNILKRFLQNAPVMDSAVAECLAFLTFGILVFVCRHIFWHLPLQDLTSLTGGYVDFVQFGELFIYYVAGAFLYHFRDQMDVILGRWPHYLSVVILYFFLKSFSALNANLMMFLQGLTTVAICLLVLGFCRFCLPESFAKPWVSNFSYSLYLFHLPVLILLRKPVMDLTHLTSLRFVLMCTSTICICVALHMLIIRSKLLSYFLNGESQAIKERHKFGAGACHVA